MTASTLDPVAESFAFTVLNGRDAPMTARHAATAQTEAWVGDGARFNLDLLLSEVVTNAVKHGVAAPNAPIVVEGAQAGRRLRVDVTNVGPAFEHDPELPGELETGGRGLALVDAMAERWGNLHDAGRTTVWFELDLG